LYFASSLLKCEILMLFNERVINAVIGQRVTIFAHELTKLLVVGCGLRHICVVFNFRLDRCD